MQVKKNPEVEVGRNSSLYFAVGLNLMLFLSYLALEHKTIIKEEVLVELAPTTQIFQEEIPIIKWDRSIPPPPPPAPQVQSLQDLEIVDDQTIIAETIFESTETSQNDIVQDYQYDTGTASVAEVTVEEVEEEIEVPFAVIENIPVFPGCEGLSESEKKQCFQEKILEHVKDNFYYPDRALELGIQGRVHVLFKIDNKGNVTDIQTRGPDKMLEKEASRIISKLPKMVPGKQRGRPVAVPYSIPISFVHRSN
ncbi:MAG: energy transducer TonB [Bacteroidota bacterium]